MGLYESTVMDTVEKKIPWYYIALAIGLPATAYGAWHQFGAVSDDQLFHGRDWNKGSRSSFSERYHVVKEREPGIDSVLDDIIGDLPF